MPANAIAVAVDEPAAAISIGLPALCQMAFDGHDLAPVWNKLVHRVRARAGRRRRAARPFDHRAVAGPAAGPRALQAAALKLQRRLPAAAGGRNRDGR